MAKLTDMLKFRRGLLENLPAARVPGTIYITTDEKGMYVDLSSSERIRVGDLIQVPSFASKGEGPFFPSVLYYFEAENALAKYTTDGKWIQINNTSDLEDNLDKLQTKYTTLASEVHGTDGNGGMKGEITTLKTTTSTATKNIEELQTKVEGLEVTGGQANVIEKITAGETDIEVEATSKTAKLGHLAAPGAKVIAEDLSDALKTRIETLEGTDVSHAAAIQGINTDITTNYVKKTELNAEKVELNASIKEAKDAANAAQGTANTAVSDAAAAQAAAEAAQDAAEAAQATADSNAATITGVSGRVETIENKLSSVTNVMDFIGVSTTDPATGTVTVGGTIIPPNKGDVVIYGNKEFVYDGSAWKEYGDVGAQEAAITTLQGKVTTLEGEMDTAQADITSLGARTGSLETRVTAAESQLVWYDFNPSTDNT